ncbi:MAG: plasmid partitioning protein RepB [Proteobacteria bacterium]|nr:plasmid partitioning protein RepB [Pseudomonadota bacterium]
MARKNLLDGLLGAPQLPAGNSPPAPLRSSPAPLSHGGAIGSVTRSIELLRVEASEARELRTQLEAGQTVVELDADAIDSSIISDRLGFDAEQMSSLISSIAEHGQQVPVLLRRHPDVPGRYQVAYGHRRVKAARHLGRKVRAIVRPLTDAELVVAQGQENNARTDLTFIERALFAARLEDAGFDRPTIMAALAVDKTAASKLIAVVRRIPTPIIEAIGPAPKAGRDRWITLSERLETKKAAIAVEGRISEPDFGTLGTDQRFLAVFAATDKPRKSQTTTRWIEGDGKRVAQLVTEPKRSLIVFGGAQTAQFARFVSEHIPELYQDFLAKSDT